MNLNWQGLFKMEIIGRQSLRQQFYLFGIQPQPKEVIRID